MTEPPDPRRTKALEATTTPAAIEEAQLQINYLNASLGRTRCGRYRAEGCFIGSRVVEAWSKNVVGRRPKASGMFWSQQGADALLTLRCMNMSDDLQHISQAGLPLLKAQRAKPRK